MVTYLYRCFGHSDTLLYVGITQTPHARFRAHRRKSPWMSEVSRVTVKTFADRLAAAQAECDAINTENPRWNNLRKRKPVT